MKMPFKIWACDNMQLYENDARERLWGDVCCFANPMQEKAQEYLNLNQIIKILEGKKEHVTADSDDPFTMSPDEILMEIRTKGINRLLDEIISELKQ